MTKSRKKDNATFGDAFLPTAQKVYFENTEIGDFETEKGGAYEKSDDFEILVSDNKLTLRLELFDKERCAGIKELNFKRIDR